MSTNPFDRQAPLPGLRHIIVVGSGKGGVGKSTVAVNLALALKSLDQKVGLLDADIYGPSIPRLMGAHQQKVGFTNDNKVTPLVRHGISTMSIGYIVEEHQAVVWRGPMLFKVIDQFLRDVIWGDLDYLIVDLPPGTGDIALTLAQKVPLSGALVVTTPQNLALVDAKKAIDMFEQLRIPILGVVENMAYLEKDNERIQLFPSGELNQYLDAKNTPKIAELPFVPAIGLCSEAGIPIVAGELDSPISQLFIEMAKKVLVAVKPNSTPHLGNETGPAGVN